MPILTPWKPVPGAATRPAPGAPCPTCRSLIGPGDPWYCPDCQASGFDALLAAQRAVVGTPPHEPRASPRTVRKVVLVASQVRTKAARLGTRAAPRGKTRARS